MATLPPKSIISGLSNDTIDYSSLFDRQTRILRIREPVELVYTEAQRRSKLKKVSVLLNSFLDESEEELNEVKKIVENWMGKVSVKQKINNVDEFGFIIFDKG